MTGQWKCLGFTGLTCLILLTLSLTLEASTSSSPEQNAATMIPNSLHHLPTASPPVAIGSASILQMPSGHYHATYIARQKGFLLRDIEKTKHALSSRSQGNNTQSSFGCSLHPSQRLEMMYLLLSLISITFSGGLLAALRQYHEE